MGFMGMGWQEIGIIVIIAVIIFGPDKLPEMAGQAGKLLRDARKMTQDMSGEFQSQTGVDVRDLKGSVEKEISGLKTEFEGASSSIQKEVGAVTKTANSAAGTAKKAVNSASKSVTGTKSKTAAKGGKSTTAKGKSVTSAKSRSTKSTSSSSSTKTANAAPAPPPQASKSDPLADVSMMSDSEVPVAKQAPKKTSAVSSANGSKAKNGSKPDTKSVTAAEASDAIARARSRRISAGYNQQTASIN